MRTVPPSQRQVCFAGALAAAAVALVFPSIHLPSSAPAASLDAAMLRPSPAALRPSSPAGQPGFPAPQELAFYRAVHHPAPAPSAPRVSDDLESASVIPSAPAPAHAQQPVQAATAAPAPAPAPYPSYTPLPSQSGAYGSPGAQGGSSGGTSSFQACVIARESGGNPQVMNASGHYGLYQFDLGTWISGGGIAADFGHASVAEQNAVFASVYAARGTSPWAPYDGCS